ncbi:MAG: GNAT family N-acetyltransferase [Sphingomonas sp.]|nr:GNAT family N-acetyltransferase [Sphingomonas sp.]
MIFIETERLILRRPRDSDLDALMPAWADPEMTRYTVRRDDPRAFLRQLIADMQAKQPGAIEPGGPWYQFVLARRADGAVVGDIGVGFDVPGERQVELGYRILPAHQRQAYVREALTALIPWLIDAHRVHRFVAVATAENIASVKIIRALGFHQEGHFREAFLCDGRWIDDLYFALLAKDWRG